MGAAACSACCQEGKKLLVQTSGDDALSAPTAAMPVYDQCVPVDGVSSPSKIMEVSVNHKEDWQGKMVAPSERASEDCENSVVGSSAPSDGIANNTQAQKIVKEFVRSFVKGRSIQMLSTSGTPADCLVSLDKKLTSLSIARGSSKDAKKRGVPLDKVSEVRVGEDGLDCGVELPLDDFCVMLLLHDGAAIAFKFQDMEERDTFALCITMLIDGRKVETSRQKGSSGKARKV